MRFPRFTTRRLMVLVAIVRVVLATNVSLLRAFRPRPGVYPGPYRYLDENWHWREIRGAAITVVQDGSPEFVD